MMGLLQNRQRKNLSEEIFFSQKLKRVNPIRDCNSEDNKQASQHSHTSPLLCLQCYSSFVYLERGLRRENVGIFFFFFWLIILIFEGESCEFRGAGSESARVWRGVAELAIVRRIICDFF